MFGFLGNSQPTPKQKWDEMIKSTIPVVVVGARWLIETFNCQTCLHLWQAYSQEGTQGIQCPRCGKLDSEFKWVYDGTNEDKEEDD